jgi:hypothetical protein
MLAKGFCLADGLRYQQVAMVFTEGLETDTYGGV